MYTKTNENSAAKATATASAVHNTEAYAHSAIRYVLKISIRAIKTTNEIEILLPHLFPFIECLMFLVWRSVGAGSARASRSINS